MNARFYDSNSGRFLTQDTYKGNAWDPMSQHLYAYTGNNPVNYVDPTGHTAIPAGVPSDVYNENRQYFDEEVKDLLENSGLYLTMDDAAVAWAKQEMQESIEEFREHGTAIYKTERILSDGTSITLYGYGGTVYGPKFNPNNPEPLGVDLTKALEFLPDGVDRDEDVVAFAHTHSRGGDIFSMNDRRRMVDTQPGKPLYMVFSNSPYYEAGVRVGVSTDPCYNNDLPQYWSDPSLNYYGYQGINIAWFDLGPIQLHDN